MWILFGRIIKKRPFHRGFNSPNQILQILDYMLLWALLNENIIALHYIQ